jgi:hypothetical protein
MAVSVKGEADAGVTGAPIEFKHVAPGFDPQCDGGVPEVIGPQWCQSGLLDGWVPIPSTPRGCTQYTTVGGTEDGVVARTGLHVVSKFDHHFFGKNH